MLVIEWIIAKAHIFNILYIKKQLVSSVSSNITIIG